MWSELVVRFVAGGLIVSAFAAASELMKPKSLAGIFGAAPSVALVTLGLGFSQQGPAYVAAEAGTMMRGAVALLVSAAAAVWLVRTERVPAVAAALGTWAIWLAMAFALVGVPP